MFSSKYWYKIWYQTVKNEKNVICRRKLLFVCCLWSEHKQNFAIGNILTVKRDLHIIFTCRLLIKLNQSFLSLHQLLFCHRTWRITRLRLSFIFSCRLMNNILYLFGFQVSSLSFLMEFLYSCICHHTLEELNLEGTKVLERDEWEASGVAFYPQLGFLLTVLCL